jgi:hypothetical protein
MNIVIDPVVSGDELFGEPPADAMLVFGSPDSETSA